MDKSHCLTTEGADPIADQHQHVWDTNCRQTWFRPVWTQSMNEEEDSSQRVKLRSDSSSCCQTPPQLMRSTDTRKNWMRSTTCMMKRAVEDEPTSPSSQIPYVGRAETQPTNVAMAENQERLMMKQTNPVSMRTLMGNSSLETSTPENEDQMSPSMHSIILRSYVPPLIPNSNSCSNSKTIMPSISKLPNVQYLDSQDAHSFLTHNGTMSSLTDMSILTKSSLVFMPLTLTTERHRRLAAWTSASTLEVVVGNP